LKRRDHFWGYQRNMSVLSPKQILSKCFLPFAVDYPQGRKPDLREVGQEIYELITNTERHAKVRGALAFHLTR
jgi:hypothetical protein